MTFKKSVAKSGLSWGFELESILESIFGDSKEMEVEYLLNILVKLNELQPFLEKSKETRDLTMEKIYDAIKFGIVSQPVSQSINSMRH